MRAPKHLPNLPSKNTLAPPSWMDSCSLLSVPLHGELSKALDYNFFARDNNVVSVVVVVVLASPATVYIAGISQKILIKNMNSLYL